jgi:lysophospholipase L1-like esterase
MQLHSPAPARAPRRASLGVVSLSASLLTILAVLLSGCQPRSQLGPAAGESFGQSGTDPISSGKPLSIVALGDSYSSGEGNAPFDLDAPGCDRAGVAWPRLLGQRLTGSTVRLLACSGARTAAFTTSFHGQPPQVEALRALVASGVKPNVVTITIGGNDAGFGPTIVSCVIWHCFWTGHDDYSRHFVTEELPPLLEATYAKVKAAAGGARVIVIGYPDLFPTRTANTCRWLANNERVQLIGLNNDLNRVARRAANEAGIEFLAVDRVLGTHRLCTKDPWLYPVAVTGAGLQASAHPNAQGERAIAGAVYDYLAKGK